MKILAIEFSSPQRSVAAVNAGDSISEVVEMGGRSMNLLGMAEKALLQAQMPRSQIEVIAIGLGPGSYTGIRGAIALAQGWQLARGVKLLGISSAACIAAQARNEGMTGPVEIVIDAQREEFYLAACDLTPEAVREITPLRLASLAEVRARGDEGKTIIGPEVTKWFPAGRLVFPRAVTLGKLAATWSEFVPGENLEPIYLRETKFIKAPPPRILPD